MLIYLPMAIFLPLVLSVKTAVLVTLGEMVMLRATKYF